MRPWPSHLTQRLRMAVLQRFENKSEKLADDYSFFAVQMIIFYFKPDLLVIL